MMAACVHMAAARELVTFSASSCCDYRMPAAASSSSGVCLSPNRPFSSLHHTSRQHVPVMRVSVSEPVPSCGRWSFGKRGTSCAAQWRRSAKRTGADANNPSSVEYLDPHTGEYRDVGLSSLEEEYGVETEDDSTKDENDEEMLKRFAAAIGLDDHDAVGSMVNKMRNPAKDRIVRQLEEGIMGSEELLKDMYRDDPDILRLYDTVQGLIESGDLSSARDIIDGNYEALMDQMHEGTFGLSQVALLDVLAALYLLMEDKDAAEQLLEQAMELLKVIPDTRNDVENVLEHVATLFLKMNRPRESALLFQRCLSIRQSSEARDVSSIVRTMVGLAQAYSELQLGDKSIEIYREILSLSEQALGANDEDLAAPLMHLGTSLLDEGRMEEAELAITRAITLTERAFGGKDGRYGVALCVLAQIQASKGDFDEAVGSFRKGLQVMDVSKDFKSADASLATVRMDLAALLSVMGREKEAQAELKKTNIVEKEDQQYYAFQKVEYLERRAEQYAEEGELELAERTLRQGLQILVGHAGPDAVQVSVLLQVLSTLLHAQPDRQHEAEPLIREAIRIREKKYGKSHIAVAEAYSYLASILHQHEQDAEAADLMYRVLHIQEKEMGFEHPLIAETLEVLHMLLVNLGRLQETIPILQRLNDMKDNSSYSFDL